MSFLSAEDLLAGSGLHHEVPVPIDLLNGMDSSAAVLKLRPLTIGDLSRIRKACGADENLSATLMIQNACVDPPLKLDQVSQLPAGLARFLLDRINQISGIDTPKDVLEEQVQAPLARACFILAKEFGWTPEEVSGMTLGQVMLYVQMTREGGDPA